MKKIIILMPYFGRWPEWINLFIESCKYNPTIEWVFFTDCKRPENKARNVKYVKMSLKEFEELVSKKLKIKACIKDPYKICDFRAGFAVIFEDYIRGYDYFGYGDLDVVYGDIRKFVNPILSYDLISFHKDRISDHFFLIKNNKKARGLHLLIKDWKDKMQDYKWRGLNNTLGVVITESFSKKIHRGLGRVGGFLKKNFPTLYLLLKGKKGKSREKISYKGVGSKPIVFRKKGFDVFMVESYNTPFSRNRPWKNGFIWPSEWYWRKGKLTNNKDKGEFLYLHFMRWKGGKWGNGSGNWENLKKLIYFDYKKVKGWKVTEKGFFKI